MEVLWRAILYILFHLKVNDTDESESLISYLVQHKADVNARDDYLMTPLHYAASKANLTAVKELLQFDGVKIDVSCFNYNIKKLQSIPDLDVLGK